MILVKMLYVEDVLGDPITRPSAAGRQDDDDARSRSEVNGISE
jgi:hypothetical protein